MEMDVKIMDEHFKEQLEQEAEEKVPLRMYITKEMLEKYGYTKNCQGCRAMILGTTRQGHSNGCRKRIETEAKDEPKAKAASERIDAYLEKVLKAEDSGERKKRGREEDQEQPEEEATSGSSRASGSSTPCTSAATGRLRREQGGGGGHRQGSAWRTSEATGRRTCQES